MRPTDKALKILRAHNRRVFELAHIGNTTRCNCCGVEARFSVDWTFDEFPHCADKNCRNLRRLVEAQLDVLEEATKTCGLEPPQRVE